MSQKVSLHIHRFLRIYSSMQDIHSILIVRHSLDSPIAKAAVAISVVSARDSISAFVSTGGGRATREEEENISLRFRPAEKTAAAPERARARYGARDFCRSRALFAISVISIDGDHARCSCMSRARSLLSFSMRRKRATFFLVLRK